MGVNAVIMMIKLKEWINWLYYTSEDKNKKKWGFDIKNNF
jgi:hypothetical protein